MEPQPVISVRGQARVEADPEIAVIAVTVQARDRAQRALVELLASRNRQVLDLLGEYGEAVEKVESGPVSAYPEIKPKGQAEKVERYAGQARIHATIRDFTVLGELVTKLAGSGLVSIAGPWWSLRPDSPVHRQARTAAAHDAARRAQEYAEAFGGRLGQLIEAADAGLLTGQPDQETRGSTAASGRIRGGLADGPPTHPGPRARQAARHRPRRSPVHHGAARPPGTVARQAPRGCSADFAEQNAVARVAEWQAWSVLGILPGDDAA